MIGTNRTTHISFPDMAETSYHDITTGIAEGSLLLDEILMTDKINLGEVNTNRFEVQLYNISDVSGQRIEVWQVDNDTNISVPLFKGYVDSCKQNRAGYYREIIAYDILSLKINENISNWWTNFWGTYPATTLKNLREALLEQMNVAAVTPPESGYVNDLLRVERLEAEPSLTFGALLKMICELQCVIPNINRDGILDFVQLSSSTTDIKDNTNTKDTMFEEFQTDIIDGVVVYDLDNVILGYNGTSSNPYPVKDNILVKGIRSINELAATMYRTIQNIRYTPGDIIQIISDPEILLGDKIEFLNGKYSYVFENVLSGSIMIEQEISSRGTKSLQEDTEWNSSTASMQRDIENNKLQYYTFSNTSEIILADGQESKIMDLRFASNKATIVIFQAEILLSVDTTVSGKDYYDDVVTAKYVFNEEVLTDYLPAETYVDGKHILHLLKYITIQEAKLNHLELHLKTQGGTITIGIEQLRCCLYGQNLVATDIWDGIVDITEQVTDFNLDELEISTATDSVSGSTQTPTSGSLEDRASDFNFIGLTIESAQESVLATTLTNSQQIITENEQAIITETGDTIYTEGD